MFYEFRLRYAVEIIDSPPVFAASVGYRSHQFLCFWAQALLRCAAQPHHDHDVSSHRMYLPWSPRAPPGQDLRVRPELSAIQCLRSPSRDASSDAVRCGKAMAGKLLR